jgi:hypothetical protein
MQGVDVDEAGEASSDKEEEESDVITSKGDF